MYAAVACARVDDARRAALDGGAGETGVRARMAVEDRHIGKGRHARKVEFALARMTREHAAAKMRRPIFHAAERADIGRGERLHGRRMHLLDVACAVDFAVQHDERALSVRFGAGGKSHGIEEVQGAVGG